MTLLVALAAGGGAVASLALVLAVAAWVRLARLRGELAAVRRSRPPDTPPQPSGPRGTGLDIGFDPTAIRDVAVVRYDALQEMGGRLSFSLALLNAAGDGVVVSSINGRTETRTYAKVIRGGKPTHPLSPEEERAVRDARAARADQNGSPGTAHPSRPSEVNSSPRPFTAL